MPPVAAHQKPWGDLSDGARLGDDHDALIASRDRGQPAPPISKAQRDAPRIAQQVAHLGWIATSEQIAGQRATQLDGIDLLVTMGQCHPELAAATSADNQRATHTSFAQDVA